MPTEPEPVTLYRIVHRAALRGDLLGTPRGDGHPPQLVADWLADRGVEI